MRGSFAFARQEENVNRVCELPNVTDSFYTTTTTTTLYYYFLNGVWTVAEPDLDPGGLM